MTRFGGRDDVVRAALAMLGTPFQHQGRRPGVGLDCAGLCVCAVRRAGFRIADQTDYREQPDTSVLFGLCRKNLRMRRVLTWRPGDIILLGLRNRANPQHMAVGGDDGEIIHVEMGSAVLREKANESRMRRLNSVWEVR